MARAFTRIAFTPGVKAVQERLGSRRAYSRVELGDPEVAGLGPTEIEFIAERDSFYQATVGENGWPYVQHRGGPAGFLKVLDDTTLGYADFGGNRQYISVGNLAGDDRVCLFLIDYAQQRRLKVWGRARVVDEAFEPELLARLESPGFRAPVERGILIRVEAADWNCPKYITPRYTDSQFRVRLEQTARATRVAVPQGLPPLGTGPLALVVSGIRQMTPRVRAYELRAPDWSELPPVTAGSHLAVPIRLADGSVTSRQYSLATNPARRDLYEIAVLSDNDGLGGSAAIHAGWRIGTRINVEAPVNFFPLIEEACHSVLIAGGIGITPIKAMAHALYSRGSGFELHYVGQTPRDMAYRDCLADQFPGHVHFHCTRLPGRERPDFAAILRNGPADKMIYVCGPATLLASVRRAMSALGISRDRLQVESFV